ncbi:FolC bifunctional protein [Ramaria rubella]|nr:FolC bifunctional protein [Ramaria rubella]
MSINLSLDRIQRLFALLPAYKRPTIHVAGTNGKGSVTAILSSIFASSHISVGRFNSPHLVYLWDSISINDRPVSQETYSSIRSEIENVDKMESVGASSFEIMTATAAQVFEQAGVDVAIFEVGLGGRLDATNVLQDQVILASVITSVDLDHQQFLGNTVSAIAREKAGIARKVKPCILGTQRHSEVLHVVTDVVHTVGGHLIQAFEVSLCPREVESYFHKEGFQSVVAPFYPWHTELKLELPLRGAHQLQNLATALTTLSVIIKERSGTPLEAALNRISPSTLFTGVRNTKWPGRLERIDVFDPPITLLVDGAHNAASATALEDYLSSRSSQGSRKVHSSRLPCTFILGLSHSPPKTPLDTLSPLLHPGDRVALVPFSEVEDMPWVKNAPTHELKIVAQRLVKDGEVTLFEREPDEAILNPLRRALFWAAKLNKGEEIVLAGSLYLVADLYRIMAQQN